MSKFMEERAEEYFEALKDLVDLIEEGRVMGEYPSFKERWNRAVSIAQELAAEEG